MSTGGEPITKCPVCRYDLTGLPTNHRCPECGFEYDETMRIWTAYGVPTWRWIIWVSLAVMLGAFSTLNLLGALWMHRSDVGFDGFQLLMALICTKHAMSLRAMPYVVVGQRGLVVKMGLQRARWFEWANVQFLIGGGGLFEFRQGSRRPLELPIARMEQEEYEGMWREIRTHLERTRGEPSGAVE